MSDDFEINEKTEEERDDKKNIILTIRTTTGRENSVIDSIMTKVKAHGFNIKSVFHPEEFRGYVFIEGTHEDIENVIKNIPHIRGLINKVVSLNEIERFIVPEKQEIKVEIGDIVEIIAGPFKGEKAKTTRVDETKNEITVELLEAAIPIPVTISINSIRIDKKKS